ncbi:MAG TPA: pyridoxal-phosphate dependent enzyme [Puia sp.]
MPAIPAEFRLECGEGQTPLLKSRSIGDTLGIPNLYFKLESMNPTGSYKDRFAGVFVSLLQSRRQNFCLATSSGNTGAALAAYCAAADIRCVLAIVDGAPFGKVRQMQLYGAHAFMIKGFGKDTAVTAGVFAILERIAGSMGLPLPISAYRYCPEGMRGVQTIAYEILEETEGETDHIFSPSGGGGLTLAVARGCIEYSRQYVSRLPKVHCVQPEGNNSIAGPLRGNLDKAKKIDFSSTAISGLQVPNILDGDEVISTCRTLGGNGYIVTDAEVFKWQRLLALREGIFCEPAAAVALAGLAVAVEKKEVFANDKVICLVTGSGFKDMQSVDQHFQLPGGERIDGERLDKIVTDISNNIFKR